MELLVKAQASIRMMWVNSNLIYLSNSTSLSRTE